nr:hypothetical protein OH837_38860 [Streptomyces canus]
MLDFTILADDASAYLRLYNGFAVDSGMTAVGSLLRERGDVPSSPQVRCAAGILASH